MDFSLWYQPSFISSLLSYSTPIEDDSSIECPSMFTRDVISVNQEESSESSILLNSTLPTLLNKTISLSCSLTSPTSSLDLSSTFLVPIVPKPVEVKSTEAKPVEPKHVKTKPIEPKHVKTKPDEAKSTEPNPAISDLCNHLLRKFNTPGILSIRQPLSTVIQPSSTVLQPQSTVIQPPCTVIQSPPSVFQLSPTSTILQPPPTVIQSPPSVFQLSPTSTILQPIVISDKSESSNIFLNLDLPVKERNFLFNNVIMVDNVVFIPSFGIQINLPPTHSRKNLSLYDLTKAIIYVLVKRWDCRAAAKKYNLPHLTLKRYLKYYVIYNNNNILNKKRK